jgi:hypothetical protein
MTIIVLPTPKRVDGYDDDFEPFPTEEKWQSEASKEWERRKKEREQNHAEAAVVAKAASKKSGLPKLAGTAKQKLWAETLRARYFAENPGTSVELLADKIFCKAKFWIDQRNNRNMRVKMSKYAALGLALADAQIALQARLHEMPQCRDVPMSDPVFALQGQVNSIVKKMAYIWTRADDDDRRR